MNGQTNSEMGETTSRIWSEYTPYFQDNMGDAAILNDLQKPGGPNDVYANAQAQAAKYGAFGDAALVGMLENGMYGGAPPTTGGYNQAFNSLGGIASGGGGGFAQGSGRSHMGEGNLDPGAGYNDRAGYQGGDPWQNGLGYDDLRSNYFDRAIYNEGPGYSDNQSFNENGPYQDASQFNSHDNPYMDRMVSNAQESVATNLKRNIMPSIGDNSGGAGQYGSSRQGIAEGLALSDANSQSANIATQMYGQMYENNEQRRATAFEGAAQRALAGNEGYNTRALQNVDSTQGRRLSAFEGAAGRALQAFEGAMGREYGGWGLGEGNSYNAWNDAQNRSLAAFEGQAGRDYGNIQSINDRGLQAWLQDTQGNTARDTANIGADAQRAASAIAANASTSNARTAAQVQAALGQSQNELQRMGLGQSQQELYGNLMNQIIGGSGNLYNLGIGADQAAWAPLMNYAQIRGGPPVLSDSYKMGSGSGGGIT